VRNFIKNSFLSLGIIVLLTIVLPINVNAIEVQPDDIFVEINPENPRPFGDVSLSLGSYAIDINKAEIVWSSNKKILFSGTGKTVYSFKAGGVNTNTIISIEITPEETSIKINKQIVITPSDMDILWEAVDSYTPPFYKGKALPSQEGLIKIVALPNTSGLINVDTKNISYTWKLDDTISQNASGFGKSSYTFRNSSLSDGEKISVVASGKGSSYNTEGFVKLNITNPELIFYKKSPTEGIIYENAFLNDGYVTDKEITFVAEPYFLAMKNNISDFSFKWKINGEDIETPKKPRQLTVRPDGNGGYATINLSIESLSRLFQSVAKNLRINL